MQQLQFGLKRAATERAAFVMGIVNATPDSFYSESRGGADRALQLLDEGADILDSIHTTVLPLEATKDYDIVAGTQGHLVDKEANIAAIKEFLFSDDD